MREIKFRAWLPKVKKMEYKIEEDGDLADILTDSNNGAELYKVMQYTGLKDKNGIEIYEGDIVNCMEYECCGKIEWNEEEAGFYFCMMLEDGGFQEEHLYDYIEELKVVGNIYENIELLEGRE